MSRAHGCFTTPLAKMVPSLPELEHGDVMLVAQIVTATETAVFLHRQYIQLMQVL